MIRPLSLYQAKEHSGDVALVGFHDTYHAPLNPLVNSVILNFFKGETDDEGNEFMRFEPDRRELIKYDDLPEVLIKAFVAAEDHKFFEHPGVSVKGIIRSGFSRLVSNDAGKRAENRATPFATR